MSFLSNKKAQISILGISIRGYVDSVGMINETPILSQQSKLLLGMLEELSNLLSSSKIEISTTGLGPLTLMSFMTGAHLVDVWGMNPIRT